MQAVQRRPSVWLCPLPSKHTASPVALGIPTFASSSYDSTTLSSDSSIAVDYLIAPPRMAHYEKVSRQIYGIYLKYIAPEDIVVYSIDE